MGGPDKLLYLPTPHFPNFRLGACFTGVVVNISAENITRVYGSNSKVGYTLSFPPERSVKGSEDMQFDPFGSGHEWEGSQSPLLRL